MRTNYYMIEIPESLRLRPQKRLLRDRRTPAARPANADEYTRLEKRPRTRGVRRRTQETRRQAG